MNMKKYANVAISCIALLLFLVFIAFLGTYLGPHGLFTANTSEGSGGKERPVLTLNEAVLEKFSGHQVEARFHLSNNSVHSISSVTVVCSFFDKHGRYVDTDRWLIHEQLLPETNISVVLKEKKYLHTQSVSQSCSIESYSLQSQPLFVVRRSDPGIHSDEGVTDHGQH
ncbi:hypothetical protein [Desulfogranum japonicum]|uniref:hypothetical protein n=1 Tax=Desulfogranum japonicum TaxID=231447 RepID=UPI00042084D3|nr:hypothetical protein [Desulfogranum japonicum]